MGRRGLFRDDTGRVDRTILLRIVHRLGAVQPEPDPRSLGPYHVVVPVTVPNQPLDDGMVRGLQRLFPSRFVVERSPVVLADVGLVTDDFVVVRDAPRAELDSRIGGRTAEQLHLEPQFEVAVRRGRAEKLVLLDVLAQ